MFQYICFDAVMKWLVQLFTCKKLREKHVLYQNLLRNRIRRKKTLNYSTNTVKNCYHIWIACRCMYTYIWYITMAIQFELRI